jgi:hypothetical protein
MGCRLLPKREKGGPMFDTLKYVKILEEAGVSRDLAEKHIRIVSEVMETHLATRQVI